MEPESQSYNMLPQGPLERRHHLALLPTHLSLHCFTKLPTAVTVYADGRQAKMGPGLAREQTHSLGKQHGSQRQSDQGVVVYGCLGAA